VQYSWRLLRPGNDSGGEWRATAPLHHAFTWVAPCKTSPPLAVFLFYTERVSNTFFFYDLETSGLDPRKQRIMQFAGQRTDLNMKPIGDPVNVLVALSDDVLPEPTAITITGITPQKTQEEGYSEADFLKLLYEQVFTADTIVVGFNNIRFDDDFMRYTLYRNFYDPYEWAWQDGRSRWDMLDVVRMTRALRPDGIEWPVDDNGNPTNRLELLSSANGLDHVKAHDALSDVQALIAVAKLIKDKQPKLFEYLLSMRGKNDVAKLVNLNDPQPFVYASGRYPKENNHASVAYPLCPGGTPGSTIVWDLRHDPSEWGNMTVQQLRDIRFTPYEQRQIEGFVGLPAKELAYNKCPAVAPMGVLDDAAQQRIKIDLKLVQQNLAKLVKTDLADKLREAFTRDEFKKATDVDAGLYDGFVDDKDKPKMSAVRAANADELADFHPDFIDSRLNELLVRYKARNYPRSMSQDERNRWEDYRIQRLNAELPGYLKSLQNLASMAATTSTHFLLSELQLWAESIAPAD
jgi:exodeoxyribonuclease I